MTSTPPPPPDPQQQPGAFPPPSNAPGVPAQPTPTQAPAAAAPTGAPLPVDKPPRPQVKGAAILVIAGALVAGIGVYLPWLSADGESFNGTDAFVTGDTLADLEIIDGPGTAMLFFAATLLGLGIALYFAGRVLAVAIISIVAASIGLLIAIGMIAIVDDSRNFFGEGSIGIGVIAQPIGAGLALGGSIWATARRRR